MLPAFAGALHCLVVLIGVDCFVGAGVWQCLGVFVSAKWCIGGELGERNRA